MNAGITLPDPEAIRARIQACREELAALKKLLRAAEAAQRAEKARRARQALPPGGPGDAA